QPFIAHFRYRSFDESGQQAGVWTVLDDDQVEPLQITSTGQAKYIRVVMPMDVQVNIPFSFIVVATDHYGNPCPITGTVHLTGAYEGDVPFSNQWDAALSATVTAPGLFKVVPQFGGARSVYHYAQAWPSAPPVLRLVGDVHNHSGDGGAQRK